MSTEIALKNHQPEVWAVYCKPLKRMEQVTSSNVKPGQTVFRLFWTNSLQKFVTIPGASMFVVDDNGDFVPANEE